MGKKKSGYQGFDYYFQKSDMPQTKDVQRTLRNVGKHNRRKKTTKKRRRQ